MHCHSNFLKTLHHSKGSRWHRFIFCAHMCIFSAIVEHLCVLQLSFKWYPCCKTLLLTNTLYSSFCGIILQLRWYNQQKLNLGWVWNWIFVMHYCLSLIPETRQYIFYLYLFSPLDVIPDRSFINEGKFLHHWFLWCICYKSPSNL